MKLELVSFKLCPYVQRSVITLNYKSAKYDITYIDLDEPPKWFNELSPLGKVPILIVDDKTVLFESAVINEFIDETHGEPLLPQEPLAKAFQRAWIEYGSELLMSNYMLTQETDRKAFDEKRAELFQDLTRLEQHVAGPYFRGGDFSLVDTAYAPLFMRMQLSERLWSDGAWKQMPRVRRWAEALLTVPAVQKSVVPEFKELYLSYAKEMGGWLF